MIKSTYEKDITENIGDDRCLILLGERADADIRHLNEIIEKQNKIIRLNDRGRVTTLY